VPASADQDLVRSCYHLHMGKHTFSMGVRCGTTVGAYVGEDLRHQAYHRIGQIVGMERRCLSTNTSAKGESESW
jgi:hypothetical protein